MATDTGLPADKTPARAETKETAKANSYTSGAKDTFASVAEKHGVSIEDLLKANEGNLKHGSALLPVGTKLSVPGSKRKAK